MEAVDDEIFTKGTKFHLTSPSRLTWRCQCSA